MNAPHIVRCSDLSLTRRGMASLRTQLRRIPAIAWRDERIAGLRESAGKLRAELRDAKERNRHLEQELGRLRRAAKYTPAQPSWHWRVQEQARVGRHTARLADQGAYPRRHLLQKLHNYELARSHGVATPRVIGVWRTLEDVPWDSLPERFVLKSNRGFSGRGVLPLQRQGSAFRIIDSARQLTAQEIEAHYERARGVSGPFFAEDLLSGTTNVLPDDVKIYAFYGEVADVLLRRVARHGDIGSITYRFVTASGEDLGQVRERHPLDASIEMPNDLALMADVARTLSRAVPAPFVRVDLYQVPEGVVLGELTPLPGSSETFTQEHDRVLGALYDEAEGRLNLDLARGRPFAVTFGPHSRDLSVPMAPTAKFPT